jgi:hypothetical protein
MFFKEKEIPFQQWNITDSKGLDHIISNEVVIKHIKISPESEQRKIADVLRKIDFHNGDVNDFFKHLATGLCESYNGVAR